MQPRLVAHLGVPSCTSTGQGAAFATTGQSDDRRQGLRRAEQRDGQHAAPRGANEVGRPSAAEIPVGAVVEPSQDYFGRTVNIAARVQGLADSRLILATGPVVAYPKAMSLLETSGLKPVAQSRALRGIADEVAVYEIP